MSNREYGHNPDSDKSLNKHYSDLLDDYIDAADTDTTPRKENPKDKPNGGNTPGGVMHSHLMTWTQMLEAMEDVEASMENPVSEGDDIIDSPMEDTSSNISLDDPEIMNRLDQMFTPILVSQGFEKDIADQKQSEIAEAVTFTEKNIISFDDETRMSQLISVCALLLAQKKNTQNWQMFKKSAAIKKQSKINIQKEEYDDAKTLAQKYLLKVANTNNSSVARQAANDLLPQTQH